MDIDTGTDELLATLEEGVATLTLNRPRVRNALSDTLSPALRRTIADLAENDHARCVVITGAGPSFCAGGDVKGMGGSSKPPAQERTVNEVIADLTERQRTLTGALYAMPKPTIASMPGPAVGAGFSIALACDLRIMASNTFVSTGFRKVGLSGDYGASYFLTQIVGTAKARELFYTSERLDAATCLQLGIANKVVAPAELPTITRRLARDLASGPTIAFRSMKRNLDLALREDLPTCLAAEAEGTVKSAMTEDHQEAVRSFIEKRTPQFKGR